MLPALKGMYGKGLVSNDEIIKQKIFLIDKEDIKKQIF